MIVKINRSSKTVELSQIKIKKIRIDRSKSKTFSSTKRGSFTPNQPGVYNI